jgi:polyisoprenyl-phosphate glycosyltransferase
MKNRKNKPLISLIVPVLNEEGNIHEFYDTVSGVCQKLKSKYDFEIVVTDNHSTDRSYQMLSAIAAKDARLKVIRFSKNFGYQKSILTGYLNAAGECAIQLDCDLQDPPEMMEEFLNHWEDGYKVVYGVREERKEGWVINKVRSLFYVIISRISENPLPLNAGDFRLIDRVIIENLRQYSDARPYLRGMIASMGFDQIGIPYSRSARKAGDSKIKLRQMFSIAIDGIISQSVLPLRLATYVSFIVFCVATLLLVAYFFSRILFGQNWPPGFATILIVSLFGISMFSFFFGVIGEYLARIYLLVRKEPTVIVEKTVNVRKR